MARVGLHPSMGLDPATGYGRLALGLASGLEAAGLDVTLTPWRHDPVLVLGPAAAFEAEHVRRSPRWAVCLLESDEPAAELVAAYERHAEAVLVGAPSVAHALRTHGVTRPVHVVPLGVDLFGVPEVGPGTGDPFTAVSYSYGDDRKGADVAVASFLAAFGDDPSARLVVKARVGSEVGWLAAVDHPRVTVVPGVLAEAAWRSLLATADCFVFPSRAEGWGLPPREATLCGVPTIATRWLGLDDVDAWGIGLGVRELRPHGFHPANPFNGAGGRWAEPDADELVERLRWVRDHREEARALAAAGRRHLLGHHTWATAGAVIARLVAGG